MSPLGDTSLQAWEDLQGIHPWDAILLGNGASRAVWDRFGYATLYAVATEGHTSSPLTSEDRNLFNALKAEGNFEAVLSALLTARTVCKALDQPQAPFEARYKSIRDGLIAAVHHVHVPWKAMDAARLSDIRKALATHEWVFSTNYDLLLYWAMMAEGTGQFRDYFWNGGFDVTDTEVWGTHTKVLYLHGALHLYYDAATASTHKEVAREGATLLDLFAKREGTVPLCITEGSSAQKLAAMRRSDYLQFALHQFSDVDTATVIFGHSLSEVDQHIVDVLGKRKKRPLAISIFPSDGDSVVSAKAYCRQRLPSADLYFFDSRSHPLGASQLKLQDLGPENAKAG